MANRKGQTTQWPIEKDRQHNGHCVVCPFLLAIMLSIRRFTDSDYAFGIFILFLSKNDILVDEQSIQLDKGSQCLRVINRMNTVNSIN
jgi:hypothetical protein